MTTTSSNNFTGLYGSGTATVNPNTAYGNANVVSLLAASTDGANTIGNISATGNVAGTYFIGNGSQLTGIAAGSTYGDANVVTLLAGFGSNSISTTGNVTATSFFGNGAALTGITVAAGTSIVNGTSNVAVALNGNTTVGVAGTTRGTFSSAGLDVVGNIRTTGTISTVGSIISNVDIISTTDLSAGGNANVALDMNAGGNIDALGFITAGTTISAAGNITAGSGSFFLGNGSQLTGVTTTLGPTISVSGNITGGNINTGGVVSATGNVTGSYILGNGSQLTGLPATYGNANVVTLLAAFGSNTISTTGNVSGSYFLGNGSLLTGLGATYSNANVATFLAAFGSNSISTTGNVTAGYVIGNGSLLTSLTGGNVTGTVANATYAVSAGSATTAVTVTANAQPNITSVGTLTSLSSSGNITGANLVTGGQVSATGNITGGNLVTGGALVAPSFSATGNVTGGNVVSNGVVESAGNVNSGGDLNVAGSIYAIGSGLEIGNIWAAGNVITPKIELRGTLGGAPNVTILSSGTVSANGNITGGNVIASNAVVAGTTISAAGNITAGSGSFFVGNGSALTGITTTAAGLDTQVQYNNAGVLAGTNLITVNGNSIGIGAGTAFAGITGINSGTEIGLNANVAGAPVTMANIRANGSIITNTNTWSATTNPSLNRIVIGSGYNGDYTNTYDSASVWRGSQLAVVNNYKIANADTQQNVQQFSSYAYYDLQGATLTNTTRRSRGGLFVSHFGNGTMNMATSGYLGSSGGGSSLLAGNIGTATVGNVVLSQASSALNFMGIGTGGNVQSGIINYNLYQAIATGAVIGNVLGAASQFTGTPSTAPTTVVGYYMPGTTSTYGLTNSNTFRAATNYYFLKNEDSVARNQMGSLETYTEYSALNGSTSGTIDVNKNNGQVQQINLTGNATLTLSNFVTTASDGTNTDPQADTVTVIINQGGTGGYGVTFPTPSSTIKYAGNVTSLQSTAANSVSMVSITGVYMNSNPTYLITISPGFV